MAADLDAAFKKIDDHTAEIAMLRQTTIVHSYRLDNHERKTDEMCLQLKSTEMSIVNEMKAQGAKIDGLILNAEQEKGAKRQTALIAEAIKFGVWVITLVIGLIYGIHEIETKIQAVAQSVSHSSLKQSTPNSP